MNPSHGAVPRDAPGLGSSTQVQVFDGSGPKSAVESCVSQPLRLTRADPINRGREMKRHFPSSIFWRALCGVRGLDIPCSAHIGTGSRTCENQRSKHPSRAVERPNAECSAPSAEGLVPLKRREKPGPGRLRRRKPVPRQRGRVPLKRRGAVPCTPPSRPFAQPAAMVYGLKSASSEKWV